MNFAIIWRNWKDIQENNEANIFKDQESVKLRASLWNRILIVLSLRTHGQTDRQTESYIFILHVTYLSTAPEILTAPYRLSKGPGPNTILDSCTFTLLPARKGNVKVLKDIISSFSNHCFRLLGSCSVGFKVRVESLTLNGHDVNVI